MGRTWAKFSTLPAEKTTENLKPHLESKLLLSTIRITLGEKHMSAMTLHNLGAALAKSGSLAFPSEKIFFYFLPLKKV